MEYKLIRSKRRTLCLQIIDGEVIVRSPLRLPVSYIDRFVKDKWPWVEKTISKIQEKKETLGDDEIFFLGTKRNLIFSAQDLINDKFVTIKTSGVTSLEKRKALEGFLKKQTITFVTAYLSKFDYFRYKSVKYRLYRSKWGSCSPRNELTFNIKLAMCPAEVIEYIVVHELCHILQKNHSIYFWREVEKILPDYKQRRLWLRKNKWVL